MVKGLIKLERIIDLRYKIVNTTLWEASSNRGFFFFKYFTNPIKYSFTVHFYWIIAYIKATLSITITMKSSITSIRQYVCAITSVILLSNSLTAVYAQSKQAPIQIPFDKEQGATNAVAVRKADGLTPSINNSTTGLKNPDQSMEIVDKRSRYAKHYVEANGKFSVKFGGNYHYKDANGKWQDIDLNVRHSNSTGYQFENLTNNVQSYFPQHLSKGVKLINEDGQTIEFWKNPSMEILSNGNTYLPQKLTPSLTSSQAFVTYNNTYPGISDQFEVKDRQGIEHSIIVNNLSAFGNLKEGTARFTQFIPLAQGSTVYDGNGKLISKSGKTEAFFIKNPNHANYLMFGNLVVFDHSIDKESALTILSPEEKWTSEMRRNFENSVIKATYDIKFVNGGLEVAYEIPVNWLTNSSRSFPVVIDPEVIFTPTNIATGLVYNSINSNWYGYQRIANLFLSSELNFNGIINKISFNRENLNGTAQDVPTTIFLRTTNATTLASDTWNSANYTSGATQVFDGTLNVGSTIGWKDFVLDTPFNYNADNLQVMVYDRYGGGGSFKRYALTTTNVVGRSAGYRQDGSDPGNSVTLETENYLAEMKIEYTASTDCGVLNPITISAPLTSYCAGSPFTITSSGLPSENGINILWERSLDGGTTWTSISGLGYNNTISNHSAATLYRLSATCSISNQTVVSNELSVGINPANQCYCTPTSTDCDWEFISNVNIGTINNSSQCSGNGYADYTSSVPLTQITKELITPISVTADGGPLGIAVMIDYNQDGAFTVDEITYLGMSDEQLSGTITVPVTALTGITRMRIRGLYYTSQATYFNNASPACNALSSYGETEDYLVELINATGCTGTPTAGVLTANTTNLCALTPLTISQTFENQSSGIEFQYQMSQDGGTTWTTFGPTSYVASITTDTITVPTLFQIITTCTISNQSVTSNQISISINTPSSCYCEPAATNCTDEDLISSVSFASINNNSGAACNNVGYQDFTSSIAPATILATLGYDITVTKPLTAYAGTVAAWIDYNQNGVFEQSEFTFIGHITAQQTSATATINVPATALAGTTRMRVRLMYNGGTTINENYFLNNSNPSCNAVSTYGETEDYMVTIEAAADCSGTPTAGIIATTNPAICAGETFVISNDSNNPYVGITYQWQSTTDDVNWVNVGNTLQSPAPLTISQTVATKYRLITSCTISNQSATSNVLDIAMNPYEDCYCEPEIPFNCTDGDLILNVTFESINNTTDCSPGGYGDFTNLTAPGVYKGDTYPISVTVGDGWTYESIGVWIDFNKNGLFDSLEGEFFPIGTGVDEVLTGNITIDPNAVGGLTRMRVVNTASMYPLNAYACGPLLAANNYGEMEDYLINIIGIDSLVVATQGNIPAVINLPGGNLQLVSTIYPETNNQAVTWSLIPVTGTATISATGMVTASTNGTVWGKAVSVEDPIYMDSILITITNQDLAISKLGEDLFNIFPNPTKDNITIVSSIATNDVEIQILDIQGKQLATRKLTATELQEGHVINLSTYANGVYMIHVQGEHVNFKRSIIKQ